MSALNANCRIYQEGVFTFAQDQAGFFNASALVAQARPPELSEFLSQPEMLAKIFDLADSLGAGLPPQWREPRQVRAQSANYLRALRAAGVGHLVPGSVGRKARMVSGGSHSVGEVDYGPGFWLRTELAMDLAEWMSRRVSPTEENPLVDFMKRALAQAGVKSAKQRGPKSAAQLFLVGVSDKLQATLKSADESMIEDGESFEDRRDALASLMKSVKGGRA
jgi:hypothetical protein